MLRATHYADTATITASPNAICNGRLGLSIGRRRSRQPLVTRDPTKITCERCQKMCAYLIERASAPVTAEG